MHWSSLQNPPQATPHDVIGTPIAQRLKRQVGNPTDDNTATGQPYPKRILHDKNEAQAIKANRPPEATRMPKSHTLLSGLPARNETLQFMMNKHAKQQKTDAADSQNTFSTKVIPGGNRQEVLQRQEQDIIERMLGYREVAIGTDKLPICTLQRIASIIRQVDDIVGDNTGPLANELIAQRCNELTRTEVE